MAHKVSTRQPKDSVVNRDVEFLQTARENYLPQKFPQWLNYSLGAYGVEWSYAIPILAKTIYANLKGA